jgi:ATP-dependent helicase HrpA
VGEILKQRQAILLCRKPYPELKNDLNRLLPPQFLRQVGYERLAHVPRYLKALLVRAERAAVNPAKDLEKLRRIQPFIEALLRLAPRAVTPGAISKRDTCRWLIEEYKVSIFAQELGTAQPVSPKSLEAALNDLQKCC